MSFNQIKNIVFETTDGTGDYYQPVNVFKDVTFLKRLHRGERPTTAKPLEVWEKSVVEKLVKDHTWNIITFQ